ncbi:hypothetical protein [uncultured Stenotrophomonas sp.]|uniref:hypothetical protein n=1 Tax=uncultured Stenotrophomonas sp. TaxID=165438 RepID=UPI0025F79B8A|nr:hypothetical protein [uncultured Stenotrophomonas sp.]
MAAGIKVFNADGSLSFDSGQFRLFRLIARVSYGAGDGGSYFTRRSEDTALVPVALNWYPPVFTLDVANSAIYWNFSNVPANYRWPGTVEIWAR